MRHLFFPIRELEIDKNFTTRGRKELSGRIAVEEGKGGAVRPGHVDVQCKHKCRKKALRG